MQNKLSREDLVIIKEIANNIGDRAKIDKYKALFPHLSSKVKKSEQKIILDVKNGLLGDEKQSILNEILPPKISFSKNDLLTIEPKTKNQELFFNSYYSKWKDERSEDMLDMNFLLDGVAGTGKTFIALALALEEVISKGSKKKIIIVRSTAETRKNGFLPGTAEEKAQPFENLYEGIVDDLLQYKTNNYRNLKSKKIIEFMTTNFSRGTTLNDAVIIVDEYQNLNFHELDTIITRVGLNSRIVFCGQEEQSDLIYNKNDVSGSPEMKKIIKSMRSFKVINFDICDIVRSGLVYDYIKTKESLLKSNN